MTNEQVLHRALSRLVQTPSIWAWLKDNKPEVLEQVEQALEHVETPEFEADPDEIEFSSDFEEDEWPSAAEYEADLVGSREWDFSRG